MGIQGSTAPIPPAILFEIAKEARENKREERHGEVFRHLTRN